MGIGEANTLLRQLIHIRCLYVLGTITSQVAVAEVIGEDDDDVRFLLIIGFRLLGTHGRRANQGRHQGDSHISFVHFDNR